jgi:hypothetical protein
MAEEIKFEAKVDTKDISKLSILMDKLGQKVKSVMSGFGKALDNVGQKFEELPGPIGAMSNSVMGLGKAMLALVANPIGLFLTAIVGIFLALKSALTKTEAGMDALARLTSIFGAMLNPIIEAVSGLATILVDGLAYGLELVGSLFGSAASEGKKLADLQDRLEDQELALNELRAKQNKELAQARELLSDSNAALGDRRKALDQVKKSETELATKELKFAKDRLAAAKLDQKVNGATEESKKAISAAVVEVANAETELAAKRRLFNREQKKLDAEEEQAAKEKAAKAKEYKDKRIAAGNAIRNAEQQNFLDAIQGEENKAKAQAQITFDNAKREIQNGEYTATEKAKLVKAATIKFNNDIDKIQTDAEKKRIDENKAFQQRAADGEAKFIDEQYAKEQLRITQTITDEKLKQDALQQLELDRLHNQIQARKDAGLSTTDLELQLANKEIEIKKNTADATKKIDKEKHDTTLALLDATGAALSTFSQLVGEQTAMGKSLAVASAIIDTYSGADKALAAGAATPPLGFINAAAIIATGLMNVKKILSVKVPGASDSGQSVPSGPSVSIIGGTADPSAQMSASLNRSLNKPAKAYVVGNDMSSQQALDRRIQTNATFPG